MLNRFERFSFAMFEISRCWHKLAGEEMVRYGLKGPHAVYLVTLAQYPDGITAAQLSELCGRDKADVSRAMATMIEKGLVLRDCGDRVYRASLSLSESGKAAALQVCKRAALAVEYAGQGFNDSQRQVFYSVLDTITDNLQKLSQEGLPESECEKE